MARVSGADQPAAPQPQPRPKWKRVVLKLSGEAFASASSDETIDGAIVERIAMELAEARSELNTEVAVVVGGGNIWRGATGGGAGGGRGKGGYIGMLGTVLNPL